MEQMLHPGGYSAFGFIPVSDVEENMNLPEPLDSYKLQTS